MVVQVVLLHENDIVEDVLDRQCLHRQSLIAFSSQKKNELTANFSTVFRLGTAYLVDHYEHSLDQLLYFFTFFQ